MNLTNAFSVLAIGSVLLAASGCTPVEPISNEEATTSTEAAKEAAALAHLPSTPVALRVQIDAAVETITDPWAGVAANRCQT